MRRQEITLIAALALLSLAPMILSGQGPVSSSPAVIQLPVAIAKGGTGQITATAAFDALAPTTTQGDVIYHNGTDNVRLAKGTGLQFFRMNSGATAPEWATITTGGFIYSIIGGDAGGYNPVDTTAFYVGSNGGTASSDPTTTVPTVATAAYPAFPVACTITRAYLTVVAGGPGSTETGTGAIRVNNGSDTTIFNNTLQWNAVGQAYSNTSLSIALAAGDFISFKVTPPAWVTNPTVTFYLLELDITVP